MTGRTASPPEHIPQGAGAPIGVVIAPTLSLVGSTAVYAGSLSDLPPYPVGGGACVTGAPKSRATLLAHNSANRRE